MLNNMIEDPYVLKKVPLAIIEGVIFITPSLGTVTLDIIIHLQVKQERISDTINQLVGFVKRVLL